MAFLIHLFFGLLVFAGPVQAQTALGCPPYEEPVLLIVPMTSEPHFDETQNLAQIRAMSASQTQQNYSSTKHETPVGLTAASLRMDTHYDVTIRPRADNAFVCAQVTKLELTFGFEDTTVFLARELPKDSCSYQTVRGHEMTHVAIDQQLVNFYAPLLEDVVRSALREIGIVPASTPAAAEARVKDVVHGYFGNLSQSLSDVRRKQQSMLDTEDEYSRLSKSCGGELSRLIGKYGD